MGYPKGILDDAAGAIATEMNRVATDAVKINWDPVLSGLDSDTSFVTVEDLATEAPIDSDSDFELPDHSNLEVVEEGDSVVYRHPGTWPLERFKWTFRVLDFVEWIHGGLDVRSGYGGEQRQRQWARLDFAVHGRAILGNRCKYADCFNIHGETKCADRRKGRPFVHRTKDDI